MKDALQTLDARRTLERLTRKHGPIVDPRSEHAHATLTRLAAKWGAL